MVNSALLDYYRCPEWVANLTAAERLSPESGYFRFGPEIICFGNCSGRKPAKLAEDASWDGQIGAIDQSGALQLPFDPSQIIANLRYERYVPGNGAGATGGGRGLLKNIYYLVRPILPVAIRKYLQRIQLRNWEGIRFPRWPVDLTVDDICERVLTLLIRSLSVDRVPFIWFWPDGAPSCAIVTHDVETAAGRDICPRLVDLDNAYGIKSSFQIIPESRYEVPQSFLDEIRCRGFEINVHDLNHDGRLFDNYEQFLPRAKEINRYGREFGAAGFRSAALYRNLDWYGALDFSYDMSVPCVGHLEAQRGGCCTAMPYFIGKILELPVTTVQDYSLFHILNEYSIALWKRQVAQIIQRHGLASFIVHPDYVNEPRARATYESLLTHLALLRQQGKLWMALPNEVDKWWRARSQMKLVARGNDLAVVGPENARARVAYAVLDGDQLIYEIASSSWAGATPRPVSIPASPALTPSQV
jgi:hypothetical protein